MFIDTAVIDISNKENISHKICGLYNLERNIIILSKAGIKKIYINCPDDILSFYKKKIKKHLIDIEARILINNDSISVKNTLFLKSDVFMQQHYLSDDKQYIQKKKYHYEFIYSDDLFLINNSADIRKAEKLITEGIIKNTGGIIAKKINKKISIPISIRLAKTRIHPNYLTIFNMFIGFLSSYLILVSSCTSYSFRKAYIFMLLGSFFFQAASILDGVDGEVAKFTFKTSKLGGWLDTFSDNMTLLLFLISNSYLYLKKVGNFISLITISVLFVSLAVLLGVMLRYLAEHSESGSLVAYDKEFLQALPADDIIVRFALQMKYVIKKDLFSLFFLLMGFTGFIYLIIPITSFVLLCSAVIILIIHFKYIKMFNSGVEN